MISENIVITEEQKGELVNYIAMSGWIDLLQKFEPQYFTNTTVEYAMLSGNIELVKWLVGFDLKWTTVHNLINIYSDIGINWELVYYVLENTEINKEMKTSFLQLLDRCIRKDNKRLLSIKETPHMNCFVT